MSDAGRRARVSAPALAAGLAGALGAGAIERNAPLGARTTYRVGGTAAVLVEVTSEADLLAVREVVVASPRAVPVLVLGNGSNLLVADAGFDGLVLHLGGTLAGIDVSGGRGEGSDVAAAAGTPTPGAGGPDPRGGTSDPGGGEVVPVRAGGGAGLPVLARRSVEAGLTGLEWAVGIPGTVGGALKMNAGGHGSDTAACLLRFRWVDVAGRVQPPVGEDGPARLRLGYRSSAVEDATVIVWAEFATRRGDLAAGRSAVSEIVRWRRAHQPGGSNAGSVFANPPGDSAGRLVESAGLKGYRIGSARVSDKHANFIQSDEGGSADDVVRLMRHVRGTVAAASGVVLRPEVRLVGFEDDPFPAADQVAGAGGGRRTGGGTARRRTSGVVL